MTAGPAVDDELPLVGPTDRTPIPAARSIRRYTAAVARKRADAGLGEVLGDVYYAVVTTAIGILIAIGVASQVRASLPDVPAQSMDDGLSLPTLVLVCAIALAGVVLSLAGRLGPVGAGGAEATWWLGLPVDRRGLLRPTAVRLPLVVAAVAAVILGVLDGGLLADHGFGHVLRLAALAGLIGGGLVVLAGLAQTIQVSRRAVTTIGDLVITASPVLALAAVLTGRRVAAMPDVPAWVLAPLAVAVVALAWWMDTRLGRIRTTSLRESGSIASQATGAVVSLDSRELGRALTDRAVRQQRRRTSRLRLARGPISGVVLADTLVLVRSPRHVVQLVVTALVPLVVVSTPQLAGPLGVGVALVIAGYIAMLATGEGARRAEMVPVLDRLLPLSATDIRRVRLVVPGVAMLLWSVVAFGTVGAWNGELASWLALGIASAPVWAGAALRAAYRPAPNWEGPLVSTPMGALPGGVAGVLARGPDVVILGLIPVIIAVVLQTVPPVLLVVQAVLSLIALAVGASTSTKSMMERLSDASGSPGGPGGPGTGPATGPGAGPGAASGKRPGGGPGTGSGKRPAGGPGAGSGKRPAAGSGAPSGKKAAGGAGTGSGKRPGAVSGAAAGNKPAGGSGAASGEKPAGRPGTSSGGKPGVGRDGGR